MADTKTSALPAASALDGSELAPIVQGGVSKKATLSVILALLVDAAPGALDTLNELAAALGDDDNFAATVTTALATKAALVRAVSVAYGATVTPNADTTDVLNIGALTGNLTLAAPTGTPRDGQTLRVRMLQDGTGSRTVTFNAAFAFGSDVTAAMVPSAASSKWETIFEWNATDSKWRALGIARGF